MADVLTPQVLDQIPQAVQSTNDENSTLADEPANLFIGDLARAITEEDLRAVFAPFGEITNVEVKRDKITHNNLGYGFIQFKTKEQAAGCIKQCNGLEIGGRRIRIGWAQKNTTLAVVVDDSVGLETIRQAFLQFGPVMEDDSFIRPNGDVMQVRFKNRVDAEACRLGLNNRYIGSSQVRVGWADPIIIKNCVHVQFNPPQAGAMSEELLTRCFNEYGPVATVSLPRLLPTNKLKGYAFVHYRDNEEGEKLAASAIEAINKVGKIENIPVRCSYGRRQNATAFNLPDFTRGTAASRTVKPTTYSQRPSAADAGVGGLGAAQLAQLQKQAAFNELLLQSQLGASFESRQQLEEEFKTFQAFRIFQNQQRMLAEQQAQQQLLQLQSQFEQLQFAQQQKSVSPPPLNPPSASFLDNPFLADIAAAADPQLLAAQQQAVRGRDLGQLATASVNTTGLLSHTHGDGGDDDLEPGSTPPQRPSVSVTADSLSSALQQSLALEQLQQLQQIQHLQKLQELQRLQEIQRLQELQQLQRLQQLQQQQQQQQESVEARRLRALNEALLAQNVSAQSYYQPANSGSVDPNLFGAAMPYGSDSRRFDQLGNYGLAAASVYPHLFQ